MNSTRSITITSTVFRTATRCLLPLAMLCIASVVTTSCGVTGDLYLPEQAGAQETPERVPEGTTETLPETTE